MAPWLTALTALISPVTSVIGNWQERRKQVVQTRHEARLERIRAQKGDWKDEFLLVIWSAPLLCSFIPSLQENAFRAFRYISELPDWYMGGWVAISLAVFGVDKIMKLRS
jgi:hypothetical protein